jgi:hypothetical protein
VHRKTIWGLFFLITTLIIKGETTAIAQSENALYFPETGHWVTGEFLNLYLGAPDPIKVYGQPITEVFIDEETNFLVQYFSKAHFYLNPGDNINNSTRRTSLGYLFYRPGRPLPHHAGISTCRLFSQTGYEVCYAFLDFFTKYGGVAQFGYPISNFETLDGLIVQHFQLARFEWHPSMPSGRRVVLGNLGEEYFNFSKENPKRLLPVIAEGLPQPVIRLRVRAFVGEAITSLEGEQSIYVIVQDQQLRAVSDVKVIFAVMMPGGSTKLYSMAPTNHRGISSASFPFDSDIPGDIIITVTVTSGEFEKQTVTSFRVWQ